MCVAHVTKTPLPQSEAAKVHVPRGLEVAILRCLEKSPSARYATATELAAALDGIPREPDWSVGEARTWWIEFRTAPEAQATTDQRTITVKVDLAKHSA